MLLALCLAACVPAPTAPPSVTGPGQPFVPPPTSTPAVITLPPAQGTPPGGIIIIPPADSTTGSDSLPSMRPLPDTWLKVVGAPGNDLAGTSAVRLAENSYVVAAGYAQGSAGDFALIRLGNAGQMQARSYRSTRPHTGSLIADFYKDILNTTPNLWVKALALENEKLGLVFDTVWLPQVGQETTLPGWQVSFAGSSRPPAGLALTDLVKVDDGFILSGALGPGWPAHLAIFKVKASGEVSAFEYPNVRVRENGKLFLTADGHLLTAGFLHDSTGQERAVVLWLNLDGSLYRTVTVEMQDYKRHATAPIAHGFDFQDLELLPNGDVVLAQSYQVCSIACPGAGSLITRLSPTGEQLWTVRFHSGLIGGDTRIRQMRQEGDQLLIVGSSTEFALPRDIYNANVLMASLNDSGLPIWIRSLGPIKHSYSDYEYKTDFANTFLPTGDGRMIISGATDSFSYGKFTGGPIPERYDLLVGMAGLNGGIAGVGDLLSGPDLDNKSQVLVEPQAVTLGVCDRCLVYPLDGVSLSPVEYTAADLTLENRSLADGQDQPPDSLTLTVKDGGREVSGNRSLFVDPTQDADRDGLDQDWEDNLMTLAAPVFEVSEGEPWLQNRSGEPVANFVRVTPYPNAASPRYVLAYYAVSWAMDYGGGASGNAITAIEDHRGDTEKVIMAWKIINDHDLQLEWVSTSSHGGPNDHSGVWHSHDRTCVIGNIADVLSRTIGTQLMCANLAFTSDQHLLLIASESKHAIYPTLDVCKQVVMVGDSSTHPDVGLHEICGWKPNNSQSFMDLEKSIKDEPLYQGKGRWLFPSFNVGEPGHQLINSLTYALNYLNPRTGKRDIQVGPFPNENVWTGRDGQPDKFCGGLDEKSSLGNYLSYPEKCAPAIYIKLESDSSDPIIQHINSRYRVWVKTANKKGAGTDSLIQLQLYGQDYADDPQHWDNEIMISLSSGTYEQGDVDITHYSGFDIGNIKSVEVRLYKNVGENPDWLLQELHILNKITRQEWVWKSADGLWVTAKGWVKLE